MKSFYFLILLFFVAVNTKAQDSYPEFMPHGAKWVYKVQDVMAVGSTPDYYTLEVAPNDTVIEGKTCRKLTGQSTFYTYKDGLKVYMYNLDYVKGWSLFYDFGWTEGQHVFFQDSAVVKRFDTVISGYHLPIMWLNQYAVMMNIGVLNNWFSPIGSIDIVAEMYCYTDYNFDSSLCSKAQTLVQALSKQKGSIDIYPNPVHDICTLARNNYNGTANIIVTDMQGKVVTRLTHDFGYSSKMEISLATLPSGVYNIKAIGSDGLNQILKMVKY